MAAERGGRVCFFHTSEHALLDLALGDLGAGSASDLFAARADSADAPVEARVRTIWDAGTRATIRIKLYGGVLSGISAEAVA